MKNAEFSASARRAWTWPTACGPVALTSRKPPSRTRGVALQLADFPFDGLSAPVGHDDHPFGRPGGPTAFEDPRCRRPRAVPCGYQVPDGHLPQFIDDVGEQRQVIEGLDVGEWIEAEALCSSQPVRRAGGGAEVPLHSRVQACLRILDKLGAGQIEYREVNIGMTPAPFVGGGSAIAMARTSNMTRRRAPIHRHDYTIL